MVWRRVKEDEFLTIGKMVWSKDPRILVEYGIKEDGVTSWDLLLRNAQYNDAGIYECQVTSSEQIVWNVELKVIGKSADLSYSSLILFVVIKRLGQSTLGICIHEFVDSQCYFRNEHTKSLQCAHV